MKKTVILGNIMNKIMGGNLNEENCYSRQHHHG